MSTKPDKKAAPTPVVEPRTFEQEVLLHNFAVAFEATSQLIMKDNIAKGFWPVNRDDRNFGEALALVHSELSEALEGHRKDEADQHLPHHQSRTVELADAIIRIMDMAAGYDLPVARALLEKLEFNRSRPFKHGKKC